MQKFGSALADAFKTYSICFDKNKISKSNNENIPDNLSYSNENAIEASTTKVKTERLDKLVDLVGEFNYTRIKT